MADWDIGMAKNGRVRERESNTETQLQAEHREERHREDRRRYV